MPTPPLLALSSSPSPSRPLSKSPGHWLLPKSVYIFSAPWATFLVHKYITKYPAHSSTQGEYVPSFTHLSCRHCPSSACTHVPCQPPINQAPDFSSSFSWLYRILHVAEGTGRGTSSSYILKQLTCAPPLAVLRLNPRGSISILWIAARPIGRWFHASNSTQLTEQLAVSHLVCHGRVFCFYQTFIMCQELFLRSCVILCCQWRGLAVESQGPALQFSHWD